MKLQVKNLSSDSVGEIEVPDEVFDYPLKTDLIHSAVLAVQAAWRSGTHSAKGRAEVTGSGKKLYRQKGTGRSRVGRAASPIRRGGGTSHGPQPRSYVQGFSRREKRNALKSALSQKVRDEQVIVVDQLDLDSHRTAALAAQLSKLGVKGKVLLVDSHENGNLLRAAGNNPSLKTVDALGVNVYDVVDRSWFVTSQGALERLVEVLSK